MPQKDGTWNYTVQLRDGVRLYRGPKGGVKGGIVWDLMRETPTGDGKTFYHSIIASPDVFETDEEAKQDALEKLSMLRCPFDRPIDTAIKWMLDHA